MIKFGATFLSLFLTSSFCDSLAHMDDNPIFTNELQTSIRCLKGKNFEIGLSLTNISKDDLFYNYPFELGTAKLKLPILSIFEHSAYEDIEAGKTTLLAEGKRGKFKHEICHHCAPNNHFVLIQPGETHDYLLNINDNYVLKTNETYIVKAIGIFLDAIRGKEKRFIHLSAAGFLLVSKDECKTEH